MGSGRWPRVALCTTILVLLGCGVFTLGFSKAGHTVVAQHMAAEAQDRADVGTGSSDPVVERHERRTDHGRAHPEHGLHVLGACAAILAAGLGLFLRRRAGADRTATSTPLAEGWCSWSTVAAPRGLGPPARLSLCVQLC